jgi:hypothetical protein
MSLASNHQNKMLRKENYLISTALKVKMQNNYVNTEKEFQIKRISILRISKPLFSENDHLIEFHLTESVDQKFLII